MQPTRLPIKAASSFTVSHAKDAGRNLIIGNVGGVNPFQGKTGSQRFGEHCHSIANAAPTAGPHQETTLHKISAIL
jgi:hypothetical protein